MEIERRYDIEGEIPKDKIKSQMYIEQLYSVIGDNKSIPDVRIRKIIQDNNEQYLHTVKYKTDDKNSRIEIEKPILIEEYNYISSLIDKKPIKKNRYLVPLENGLIAEIDEFLDVNKIIVEVEFDNIEQANNFQKPEWFGNEIKGKQSFSVKVFSKINNNVDINFY